MAGRHDARRIALDILYQADVTGRSPVLALADWRAANEEVPEFARELVTGVAAELERLDAVIAANAEGWTLDRMAAVDRSILRLAVHELRSRPETPIAVAISEAVEAANELSTEASGRFVNGILGRIARATEGERAAGGE